MSEKVIFTDCDGVILDWEKAFQKWMIQHGYTHVDANQYAIDKQFGIPRDLGKQLVRQFNESAWMGELEAFRNARVGIARLMEAGYEFVVITSLSLDPAAKHARQHNLEQVFGKGWMKELVCLDTGADKDEVLAEYIKKYEGVKYWVEDKWENAVVGADLGLTTFLVEHGHNKSESDDRILALHDMNEVADKILA